MPGRFSGLPQNFRFYLKTLQTTTSHAFITFIKTHRQWNKIRLL